MLACIAPCGSAVAVVPPASTAIATIATIITATIAALVAWISYQQWQVAREKLRLDLYDRRFNVYQTTATFIGAVAKWNDTPEEFAMIELFFRACQEARFLFKSDSGIRSTLDEVFTRSAHITYFKKLTSSFANDPEMTATALRNRTEHLDWILEALFTVRELMMPYMDFSDVRSNLKS